MSRIETLLGEIHALDASAGQSTWLSRRDPRALVLATLAFILTVVSFHRYTVAALLPLALFPVVLAHLGNIPLRRIGSKLGIALFFALMIGMFNPLFDPLPRVEVLGHAISGGWLSLASILVRTILTVAAALILIACLGMPRLCAALDRLGMPRILANQLLFMHRYLLLLASEMQSMNLARELRSNKPMGLRIYASLLGQLLLRVLERAQRIHQAMLSRGFTGLMPVIGRPLAWQRQDTVFLAICLVTFVWMRSADLSALLGHGLMKVLA